ncbi:hypothetical protein EV424DRAFT_1351811 [Suillus variegatus]|nr:hypothetical protein EV424DRAFT_1351811 [Suillus variegatus]
MPKVFPPPELDVILLIACSNLVRHLADAYLYPDALHMQESGINPRHEQSLLERFPLVAQLMLEWPTVVLDKFGLIVLWYLPGAINETTQNDMMVATKMMSDHLENSDGFCKVIQYISILYLEAPKFYPEVSVTLKQDGLTICQAIRWPAVLAAAALRVMHGGLYWSSLTTQLGLSLWADNN